MAKHIHFNLSEEELKIEGVPYALFQNRGIVAYLNTTSLSIGYFWAKPLFLMKVKTPFKTYPIENYPLAKEIKAWFKNDKKTFTNLG